MNNLKETNKGYVGCRVGCEGDGSLVVDWQGNNRPAIADGAGNAERVTGSGVNAKGVRRRRRIRFEMVLAIRLHVRGITVVDEDEATRAIVRRALGVSREVHDICALDSTLIVGRSVTTFDCILVGVSLNARRNGSNRRPDLPQRK